MKILLFELAVLSVSFFRLSDGEKGINFLLLIHSKCQKFVNIMGRGRKQKAQKMKNRKRQAAKKARIKKVRDAVHKSRLA